MKKLALFTFRCGPARLLSGKVPNLPLDQEWLSPRAHRKQAWAWLHFGLVKKILEFVKDWKSAIFGVWVAQGPWRPFQKVGGFPTFRKGLQGPRGRPDPKNVRCQIFRKILKQFNQAKVQPRGCLGEDPKIAP